jgi:hypothetical protein
MHLHHWGFTDIALEFKVELKNTWDVHNFSFLNMSKKFSILAEGERGPLIIEYKNTIGIIFLVSKKFSPSI